MSELKHREFYLKVIPPEWGYHDGYIEGAYSKKSVDYDNQYLKHPPKYVHVIEYAAYQQAQEKLQKAIDTLSCIESNNLFPDAQMARETLKEIK